MRGALLRGLVCALPLLAQACASPSSGTNESPREPVRWVLVEKRYGDLAEPPPSGDGRVNPDATVLAFQPLYPEDLEWDVVVGLEEQPFAEVVSCTPPGPAQPGEVVTATVRVGKSMADRRYRLTAKASQSEVRILGQTEAIVQGSETAVFRFTSSSSGRAGISVGVECFKGDLR